MDDRDLLQTGGSSLGIIKDSTWRTHNGMHHFPFQFIREATRYSEIAACMKWHSRYVHNKRVTCNLLATLIVCKFSVQTWEIPTRTINTLNVPNTLLTTVSP